MEYITVKIGVPGKIKDLILDDGSTLSEALEEAGLTLEGLEVRVNGAPATPDTKLNNGDTVFGAKPITGNVRQ